MASFYFLCVRGTQGRSRIHELDERDLAESEQAKLPRHRLIRTDRRGRPELSGRYDNRVIRFLGVF